MDFAHFIVLMSVLPMVLMFPGSFQPNSALPLCESWLSTGSVQSVTLDTEHVFFHLILLIPEGCYYLCFVVEETERETKQCP